MARYIFQRRVFEGGPLFASSLATQITVLDISGSPTLAPIYDAEVDGSSIGNPFFITDLGKFEFWIEDGKYRVTATNGGNTDSWEGQIGPYSGDVPATSFSDLDDVPAYTGNAGRSVKVNGAENALVIGEPDITVGTTAASYSLSLAIWNQFKTITGSGTVNITIPLDATLDLPIGYVHCVNPNEAFSGTATWVAESGSVNVESPAGGTLVTPAKGTSGAMKRGANDWFVFGQVEAV